MPDLVNQDINQFNVYGVEPFDTHLFTGISQWNMLNEVVNIFSSGREQYKHINKDEWVWSFWFDLIWFGSISAKHNGWNKDRLSLCNSIVTYMFNKTENVFEQLNWTG
jgi:hypothetical protein